MNSDMPAERSNQDPAKYETPYDRLKRLEQQGTTEKMMEGSIWNFHYTETAGSDPAVMAKIEKALKDNQPFGLKCNRSRVVFIPHKLKAYWIWSDDEHGPVFEYKDKADLITGVKFQYLGHKEFIHTDELVALSKIILFTKALENVESWERKNVSHPANQARPLEPGAE